MTKVCHFTSAHGSEDVRIFNKECVSLAKAGFDVYLVAKGESRIESGVQVVGAGAAPANRLKRMLSFSRKVYKKALAVDADIYHMHDPELLPYGMKLKRRGKTVIFDSHEDTLEQMSEKAWIPACLRPIVYHLYRTYAKRVLPKYDAIISVTPHIVDGLRALNANTWQITNYPILQPYTERNMDCSPELVLCFTGGIDNQWCHVDIMRVLNGLDGVRYVMCGFASKEYLALLKRQEAWQRVDYRGRLSYKEALKVQSESNVGMAVLLPSNNTRNSLGTIGNTKLFEYMMNGLPLICTNFVLWKEIVDENRCGICVDPTDSEAIAEAIIYLRDHPDEARIMGENGRKAVERTFNWAAQEEKLIKLYKELL